MFPDNSTIDSWGLFYHSDSIVRGIDLSTVLKYANPYAAKKVGVMLLGGRNSSARRFAPGSE